MAIMDKKMLENATISEEGPLPDGSCSCGELIPSEVVDIGIDQMYFRPNTCARCQVSGNDELEQVQETVPERYIDLLDRDPSDRIKAWLVTLEKDCGFYIYGPHGTGKTTYLFRAIAWEIRRRVEQLGEKCAAEYIEEHELFERLKSAYDQGRPSSDVIGKYKRADLLCFDEVGGSRDEASEWARKQIFLLVNHRYKHCKETIFSGNISLTDLPSHANYDNRTVDRITEMTNYGENVEYYEKDQRSRASQKRYG